MEKRIPDLGNLHEKSKIEIDLFPRFCFRQISILQ